MKAHDHSTRPKSDGHPEPAEGKPPQADSTVVVAINARMLKLKKSQGAENGEERASSDAAGTEIVSQQPTTRNES